MRFRTWAPLGALCVLASAGGTAMPVRAHPVATTTAPAEFGRAIRALWASSPDVQAAQAEREAARARARAVGEPLYNPTLELAAENADVDRRTIGVGLALDLSGKRAARRALGDVEQDVAQAKYDQVRREVAARWLKASFAMALATRETALGQRRVELMQRFAELAERRLRVGDISLAERDLAVLAQAEAQTQQAALLGRAAAAQEALSALGIEVAPSPSTSLRELPPLAETAVEVEQLPELKLARARADSADAGVTVARRNRVPDPTLSLTGGRVRIGPGAGMSHNVIGLNLSVPLPVFNGYSAEVDVASAEADAAVAGVQAQRAVLHARQRGTESRYAALRQASVAFRGSRAAAHDERAALLERLWQAGEIGTSDYLVQLKQSLDTELAGVQLENETWQVWIDYLDARGRLLDWAVGAQTENSP